MQRLVVLLLSLALFGALWYWLKNWEPAAPSRPAPVAAANSPASPGATAPSEESLDLARDLNSPAGTIQDDLRIVATVLQTYRTNFLRTGNPVGNNAEITAALTGDNALRLAFISPTHPAINAAGELCDRWGTPFHFHAESGTRMEIRSAGPDRTPFTPDDIVLPP